MVSEEYHQFMPLFREPLAQQLPPYCSFDHQIRSKARKEVPFALIYYLSDKELEALREYLDRMLAEGKISISDANMGLPIFFVPKPDEMLGLCVNYRGLNVVTIQDTYLLPLMNKLRDRVVGCEWFTKLDL
jgi:hypothetical protein